MKRSLLMLFFFSGLYIHVSTVNAMRDFYQDDLGAGSSYVSDTIKIFGKTLSRKDITRAYNKLSNEKSEENFIEDLIKCNDEVDEKSCRQARKTLILLSLNDDKSYKFGKAAGKISFVLDYITNWSSVTFSNYEIKCIFELKFFCKSTPENYKNCSAELEKVTLNDRQKLEECQRFASDAIGCLRVKSYLEKHYDKRKKHTKKNKFGYRWDSHHAQEAIDNINQSCKKIEKIRLKYRY